LLVFEIGYSLTLIIKEERERDRETHSKSACAQASVYIKLDFFIQSNLNIFDDKHASLSLPKYIYTYIWKMGSDIAAGIPYTLTYARVCRYARLNFSEQFNVLMKQLAQYVAQMRVNSD
jgi:hypothetical protein